MIIIDVLTTLIFIGLTFEATHDLIEQKIYRTTIVRSITTGLLLKIMQGQLLHAIFVVPATYLIGKILENHIWHHGDTIYLAAATTITPHPFLLVYFSIATILAYIYLRKKDVKQGFGLTPCIYTTLIITFII